MKRYYNRLLILGVGLSLLSLVACSGNSGTPDATANGSGTSPTVSNETYFSLPDDPGERHSSEEFDFFVQTVVEGLDIPWGMAFLPNGSMLITERDGNLRFVSNGELVADPVGDRKSVV